MNVPCSGHVFSISDPAVALDDLRLDLADVLVDDGEHVLFTRQDAAARLLHARRAERVRRPRPAEGWLRSLPTLEQWGWRPAWLETFAGHALIDGLQDRPRRAGSGHQQALE